MGLTELTSLTAVQAADLVREGRISSEELVRACLERIREADGDIGAWAYLDPNHALFQARQADDHVGRGRTLGPLHGVPVGVKDIFDTADMPTEYGTPIHAGRRPQRDAAVVERLRAAGAVIMGKTVTTEFAYFTPAGTRNPHDPERTPGGSSSGSAAGVAAGMVPLAVGSQTAGSVIRPASYCGTCGFKPSSGLISRHRMLHLSRTLDQVGVFGRTVEDVALLAEQLLGYDARDEDTLLLAPPRLLQTAREEPPLRPRFAFARTAAWSEVEADARAAYEELIGFLGDDVEEIELPGEFDHAAAWHRAVMQVEMARALERDYERSGDGMSEPLRELVESGRRYRAVDYCKARDSVGYYGRLLEQVFMSCDAILTPAATSEAPRGLKSTGSPACAVLWTLCGVPSITLPLLQGGNGMPLGVQLVAARGDDARLLRTARWLARRLAGEADAGGGADEREGETP